MSRDAIIQLTTMSPPEKSRNKRLRMIKSTAKSESSTEKPLGQTQGSAEDATCPRCFGTGMQLIPGEGARRCECQDTDQRQRLFRAARIPARYQHCTLANY